MARLKSHSQFALVRLSAMVLATSPLGLFMTAGTPVLAQQNAASADSSKTLYIGAINGDDVYVRSGAGESYYPFFKVHRGDLVKVTGEKYGFVSVVLVGPTFKESFGYVKHAKNDAARIRLAADGRSAVTLGRVDIVAPNLDAGNRPKDSWKVVARLDANTSLTVLETTHTGEDTIYKVAMPGESVGWINSQFVPRAAADEAAIFEDILAGRFAPPAANPAATAPAQPTRTAGAATPAGTQPQPTGAASPTQQVVADTPPAAATSDLIPILPPPAATTEPVVAAAPEKPREPTWEDLEKVFRTLQNQPVETAELQPMRDMYSALADRHPDDARIQRFTAARLKQLEIWEILQQKKLEVLDAERRMRNSAEDVEVARLTLERSAEYTAVGRVAVSNIYDGTTLPKLFRLQDASTGRTVAYLKPDAEYALASRIDVIVGIVGDKTYDESLRLNMITPRRIDVLSASGAVGSSVAGVRTDGEEK